MGGSDQEREILQAYLDRYVKPDEQWLELQGNSATYWQARLAQTTTVSCLPDGRAKWRVRTPIVEKVNAADDATRLCLFLNWYAAGWSFAYDPQRHTVDALVSICALPEWDTYLLRLSDKAKLSAWLADVIAERLAQAVGGVAAFGKPQRQREIRLAYDVSFFYAEAVRRRPEWRMDPTLYEYLPLVDAANYIAKMVGLSEDDVDSNDVEFRMPVHTIETGDQAWLMGGFETHPVMGDSYFSAIAVGGSPTSTALSQISAMTWGLFNDPQANLLGGWSFHEEGLRFVQWNTMAEIRQQEKLDSWDGRGVGDLWNFTSTLIDPLNALSRVGLTRSQQSELDSANEPTATTVIGAVADQARTAVDQGIKQLRAGEATTSDPRLLWLERRRVLAMAVWYDSLKPTVTSLEVCTLSDDDTEYLICFLRSPLSPQYRVVGPDETGRLMTADAMRAFLPGATLPNALTLWGNPTATPDEVPQALRRRIFEMAAAGGQNLYAEAEVIASTHGRPWELVTRGSVVADWVRSEGEERAMHSSEPLDHFARWWVTVSNYENVMANFNCLPDAWDGAINSQRTYGELDAAAVGPLVITYGTAGLEGCGA
jgi:hypothetical protein